MNPADQKVLVRSKALHTWRVPGAEHQVRKPRDIAEHKELILAKLREECDEVITAQTPMNLAEEIADVIEVLMGIADLAGVEWNQVTAIGIMKEAMSGDFTNGLVWDKTL